MDLRQLKYFSAVARLGSFTAASRELHVSQPALGYKIKQLEEALGTALLERHSRGVKPTPAGSTLLRHADRVFVEIERAESAVRRHGGRPAGRIVLGITPTIGKELLPDLLDRISDQTGIELSLRQGMSHELQADVVAGRIDVAFCFDPTLSRALESTPLFRERLCLIGPPSLVTTSTAVPFDELAAYPLLLDSRYVVMRAQIEETAARRHVRLKVPHEVEPIELKKTLMVRNGACTIVPRSLFHAEIAAGTLRARRLVRPALHRTLHLVWRRGAASAATTCLLDLTRAEVRHRIAAGDLGWEPAAATRHT